MNYYFQGSQRFRLIRENGISHLKAFPPNEHNTITIFFVLVQREKCLIPTLSYEISNVRKVDFCEKYRVCASPVYSIQTSFYYSNLFELDYRHVYYSHITLYHRFHPTCNGLPNYKNSRLQCKIWKWKHFSASIHPMNHPHRKHFELIQFTFHSIELTKFPFENVDT